MRAADAANHGRASVDARTGAYAVGPRAGGVDDPIGVDARLFAGEAVVNHDAGCAPQACDYFEDFSVVSPDGAGVNCFRQPLGHQSLGEFALRIFVVEQRP